MEKTENLNLQTSSCVTTVKYAEAVRLYTCTEMTGKQIAEHCGLNLSALRAYLRRNHREWILKRNGIEMEKETSAKAIKLRGKRGQTPAAHQKYQQAIEACDDYNYIEYNVSQIARMFGHDGTALRNQLRLHYPEILERREQARCRLGINDNFARGVKPESKEAYAQAVELYRTTDRNLPSIAEECKVSLGGLSQYLRFYHKELVKQKIDRHRPGNRIPGRTGTHSCISRSTLAAREKYRESVELYRTTNLTAKEVVARTGVSLEGFRGHLRKWHRDLMLERRGITPGEDCDKRNLDLSGSKRYFKSTAAKYAPVIESLRTHPRPVAHAAAEFGVDADNFRRYLRVHEPEMAERFGKKKGNQTIIKQ